MSDTKIVVRFEHCNQDTFYEKEDRVDEIVRDAIADVTSDWEETELEIVDAYIEYAKPYGHNPYLSLTVSMEGVWFDDFVGFEEEIVEHISDSFSGHEIKRWESAGVA